MGDLILTAFKNYLTHNPGKVEELIGLAIDYAISQLRAPKA